MKNFKSRTIAILFSLIIIAGCAPATTPPPARPNDIPATPTAPPEPTATAVTIPVPADETAPWQVILDLEVTHSLVVAEFLNDTFAITVGTFGEVHYTTDGGETWPLANNESKSRSGLDIIDENVAWHIGNQGHVRVTTDGGKNWEAVTDLENERNPPYISFLDTTTGWAATSKKLWATANGGQTWTDVTLPEIGEKNIIAITLRAANAGYLMDEDGILYTTLDGGENWSSQILELDREIMASVAIPSVAIRFFDADHGVIILALKGELDSMLALRTADGGQTWTQETIPAKPAALCLTHDGTLLTVTSLRRVVVLRY